MWNKSVSERLRRFGRKVLIGDLAIRREQAHLIENFAEEEVGNAEEVEDDEE